ncbi:MAG: DPP IV N-terminal domain-containing protein, partial [Mariniphaga sp.]|nr:DPP IV N-terminal domain-containing protein [Mariniphaga sp.]
MKNMLFFVFLFMVLTGISQIQKNNQSQLTIEQIMQAPEKWIGASPEGIFWSETGDAIFFEWNPEQDTLASLYSYSLKPGKIEKVPLEEKKKISAGGEYNSNRTQKVVVRDGNIFLLDLKKGTEKQLTNWLERLSSVQFALNDTHISFLKNQNLFVLNLKTRLIRQVTNFVSEEEKTSKESKGQAKWLENQQMELFDVLKEREAMEKARENRREKEKPEQPEKIFLDKKRLGSASFSPSGNFVIYTTYQSPQGVNNTSVTQWITESGFTEEQNARAKVGSPETKVETGIFDVKNNKTISVETSSIPGLKDLPEYLSEYPERMPKDSSEIKERELNLLGTEWNETEDLAVVVALSHDNKDRWILLLDPATGTLELLDRQHDEAWIGGPGIGGWGSSAGTIGWLPDNKSVWFFSEESGYSHLYAVNIETKTKKALTSGQFEVSDAFLSNDKKHFYLTTNKLHPGVKHFYKMPAEGGNLTQITSMEGNNEVSLSPDEKHLAIRYSFANKPWELYLQENK